jgi:recombinational DNA repair protein (RecF pathway)
MSDAATLVCMRCSRTPQPPVESFIKQCKECGEAVWVSKSSPKQQRILCLECVKVELRQKGEAVVWPLTKEQLDDIKAYFRKQGRRHG